MSRVRPVFAPAPGPLHLTAVIVLYRMRASESPAFQSLMAAREEMGPNGRNIEVMLWDNSPMPGSDRDLSPGVRYFADERNSGLAAAYNKALDWARERHSEWLLTLDQDTTVPRDFFLRAAAAVRESSRYAGVGAIVPQITSGGRQLSPNYFQFGAIPMWYGKGYVGVPSEPVFGFNSGAMLSTSALRQVGGYDPRFWLDNSDAMIFSKLHEYGKRVYIAGDIQLGHEFSMKDMQRRMSPERYRNALLAETAFWDLRMSRAAGWERILRLALRLAKQWYRGDSRLLCRITGQALARRLFTSRRKRIANWVQCTAEFVREDRFAIPSPLGLKVSACMAAYNGGAFVDGQLRSILEQIKAQDEIVIVDDKSTDDTLNRIAQIGDPRIRVYRHEKNSGVVGTFEDALRLASGDLLFLSDDDDVWAPTKVAKFVDVFQNDPEAGIVQSRVRMIDEIDRPIPDSRINRFGRFSPGFWRNLVVNHYQGSAMALRASLLGRMLPFPRHKSFLHDAWIGTRNDLAGGKVAFIEEDLLLYRRHGNNASRTKSLPKKIWTRAELIASHLFHSFSSSPRISRAFPSKQQER